MPEIKSFPPKINTVVFDWGNTLMREFSDYPGRMADCPQVEAKPGIKEALDVLKGGYRIVIATNAVYSDSADVRVALARAGISEPISSIFTPRQLSFRKPELAFFRALESVLGVSPDRIVMVGDNYLADAFGPHRAGWHALWYNPSFKPCSGLLPMHNDEVYDLNDLPHLLENLDMPGVETCLAWLAEQGLLMGLWMHVQLVAALSYQMALWLRTAGCQSSRCWPIGADYYTTWLNFRPNEPRTGALTMLSWQHKSFTTAICQSWPRLPAGTSSAT